MNHDQNKKTLRQFQCRDYLWEIFEQMSAELECSVDYLINEAMRQYARSRNYGVRTPGPGASSRPGGPTPGAIPSLSGGGGQPHIPSAPPPPQPQGYGYGGGGGGGYPPPPQPHGGYGGGGGGYPPPPRPSSYPPPPPTQRPPGYGQAPPQQPQQPQPYGQPSFGGPPQPSHSAPPPLPGPGPGAGAPHVGGGQMLPLYVIFNGQKFPIAKDEFIIGRGTKTADLPIKDGNISRRHAAVIWQNGSWYIKDLGSTNGVEFQGRKIDSKRVEEGDVYQLCDYEVRFTYR